MSIKSLTDFAGDIKVKNYIYTYNLKNEIFGSGNSSVPVSMEYAPNDVSSNSNK